MVPSIKIGNKSPERPSTQSHYIPFSRNMKGLRITDFPKSIIINTEGTRKTD